MGSKHRIEIVYGVGDVHRVVFMAKSKSEAQEMLSRQWNGRPPKVVSCDYVGTKFFYGYRLRWNHIIFQRYVDANRAPDDWNLRDIEENVNNIRGAGFVDEGDAVDCGRQAVNELAIEMGLEGGRPGSDVFYACIDVVTYRIYDSVPAEDTESNWNSW